MGNRPGRGPLTVPTRVQDVTPDFMTAALRSTGTIDEDTTVADVDACRIAQGVGLMCSVGRLTLRYSGSTRGAPSSVVLKLPSDQPENRQVGDHFDCYRREGRFYEHLGETVNVRTPRCLFNHIDIGTHVFALVLEDLGARTMVSQIGGMDLARAAEAARAVAHLHAQWWESPAIRSLSWMPRATDPPLIGAGAEYRRAWPRFVERFGDLLPDGSIGLGERIGAAWEDTMRALHDEAPMTMCHGDFRADNLMFDDSVTGHDHVAVLDWQLSYRSAAINDICYLLTQSMTTDDRRAHDRSVVSIWYDTLSEVRGGAPTGYSLDDAWNGYRRSAGNMTVYSVIAGAQLDPTNERGTALVREMARRSFSAALDLDAGALVVA
jgi:hypothetical protein